MTPRVNLDLAREFEQYGVEFGGVIENTFLSQILSCVLPAVIFVAIWMYVFPKLAERSGGMGGMMSIGKSKAKVYMATDTKVPWLTAMSMLRRLPGAQHAETRVAKDATTIR